MIHALLMSVLLVFGTGEKEANGLDGTLWVQTAAEYRVAARQVYGAAAEKLEQALADKSWTAAVEQSGAFADLPPAVILDVDETVLDNSAYQARLLVDHASFNEDAWEAWVLEEKATAVPGALDFILRAHALGVTVFYVTNRVCGDETCKQEAATVRNLTSLGFPDVTADQVLLKKERGDWVSDKTSRRAFVAGNYRVLMLFGDDLGDFAKGAKGDEVTLSSRNTLVEKHAARWGRQWFLLPNPLYGSWQYVIEDEWKALKLDRD